LFLYNLEGGGGGGGEQPGGSAPPYDREAANFREREAANFRDREAANFRDREAANFRDREAANFGGGGRGDRETASKTPKLGINSNIYSLYQNHRSQTNGVVSISPDVTISSMTSIARRCGTARGVHLIFLMVLIRALNYRPGYGQHFLSLRIWIRTQGFDDQKLEKKFTAGKKV
jgi:hypothetical protein